MNEQLGDNVRYILLRNHTVIKKAGIMGRFKIGILIQRFLLGIILIMFLVLPLIVIFRW